MCFTLKYSERAGHPYIKEDVRLFFFKESPGSIYNVDEPEDIDFIMQLFYMTVTLLPFFPRTSRVGAHCDESDGRPRAAKERTTDRAARNGPLYLSPIGDPPLLVTAGDD